MNELLLQREKYMLIYKDGFVTLLALDGRRLQHFPLSARLTLSDGTVAEAAGEPTFDGETLTLRYAAEPDCLEWAVLSLTASNDEIVASFRAKAKSEFAVESLEYFRKGKYGQSVNDNCFNFSPAPYSASGHGTTLYKRPCNSSMSSYFSPPPFQMVMGNRAGKIAYSLLDMPNSYRYCLSDKYGILAECPGGNVIIGAGEYYEAPRLMLTFPDNEWAALEEYYSKLKEKGIISPKPIEEKNWPSWWKRFVVDSYGDQITQLQYNAYTDDDWDSPDYNTAWLRKWLDTAQKRLGRQDFNIVIDAFWQNRWSIDPLPEMNRFADLRGFIDHAHSCGHKVLLWIVPFGNDRRDHLAPDELTMAQRFDVLTKDKNGQSHVDWTADNAEAYLDELCRRLFGSDEDCLDADGVKIDGAFLIADPMNTTYAHPEKGIGAKELLRFYRLFGEAAKKVKDDVLVNTSTVNPFFEDYIHVNRLGDQSVRSERQARARIASLTSPNMLLDSDAVMDADCIKEDYLPAVIYSVPYLYNTDAFMLGERPSDETMRSLGQLLSLTEKKPMGRPVYISDGNWQWESGGRITAACFDADTIVVFGETGSGYVFSWTGGERTIPLYGRKLPTDKTAQELCVALEPGELFEFDFED